MATLDKIANETPSPKFPPCAIGNCTPENDTTLVATRQARPFTTEVQP